MTKTDPWSENIGGMLPLASHRVGRSWLLARHRVDGSGPLASRRVNGSEPLALCRVNGSKPLANHFRCQKIVSPQGMKKEMCTSHTTLCDMD